MPICQHAKEDHHEEELYEEEHVGLGFVVVRLDRGLITYRSAAIGVYVFKNIIK